MNMFSLVLCVLLSKFVCSIKVSKIREIGFKYRKYSQLNVVRFIQLQEEYSNIEGLDPLLSDPGMISDSALRELEVHEDHR
ncbi:hypothetical protein EDD21DRAFT_386496 [Dissophora ornata]|nr:hypothetical protein EDD21DRAFT_386496 [Dissophora ornata]